ncbi:MAG: 16S rRNA (adenine(1518)-N(6)/adenine(1519)-N(6))-dimethyltransferase RsmA [Acetobacterales bacterium]
MPPSAEPGDGLPPLREVIARHGLNARRQLGQNFLLDLNLTGRIARAAAPLAGFNVIEIGPGPGGLTRALLANGANPLVAVERDHRCLGALAEIGAVYPGALTVMEADALEVDLTAKVDPPRKIVANLPYNVATPLLIGWLRAIRADADAFELMVLMFQKEVADRLVAQPGSRTYGRLSVITQWLCRTEMLFNIAARAFTPPPKVTSTVVRLAPLPARSGAPPFAAMEAITAAAFGQRRKMLRGALRSLGNGEALLAAAGIDPAKRAEDVDVAGFEALAQEYARRKS